MYTCDVTGRLPGSLVFSSLSKRVRHMAIIICWPQYPVNCSLPQHQHSFQEPQYSNKTHDYTLSHALATHIFHLKSWFGRQMICHLDSAHVFLRFSRSASSNGGPHLISSPTIGIIGSPRILPSVQLIYQTSVWLERLELVKFVAQNVLYNSL